MSKQVMNDNRDYCYSSGSQAKRDEYEIIVDWIKDGSTVVDLGCGDGSLLQMLKQVKNTKGIGMDRSTSAVNTARKKKINASVGRIDRKLSFDNKQFDYAICNVTIQMVMYPEVLISEMQRISRRQVISFPNFAFILNRLQHLFYGRMPQMMLGGYSWYDTGHIHQLSISDFQTYCDRNGRGIVKSYFKYPSSSLLFSRVIPTQIANLFATLAVFMTK